MLHFLRSPGLVQQGPGRAAAGGGILRWALLGGALGPSRGRKPATAAERREVGQGIWVKHNVTWDVHNMAVVVKTVLVPFWGR